MTLRYRSLSASSGGPALDLGLLHQTSWCLMAAVRPDVKSYRLFALRKVSLIESRSVAGWLKVVLLVTLLSSSVAVPLPSLWHRQGLSPMEALGGGRCWLHMRSITKVFEAVPSMAFIC